MVDFNALVQTAFQHVVRVSVQATVIAGLVVLVHLAARRHIPARWRYAMWLVVLVRLLLPAAPRSPTSVFNLARETTVVTPAVRTLQTESTSESRARPAMHLSQDTAPAQRAVPGSVVVPAAAPATARPGSHISPWSVLGLVWLCGVCAVAVRLVFAALRLHTTVRDCVPVDDAATCRLFAACCAEMRVSPKIPLLVSAEPISPAVAGVLRPKVIVSHRILASLDLGEQRLILLHELAHVRRRDVAVHWLFKAACAVHWFNPAVWLAAWRMRAERETACDETVLERIGRDGRSRYGRIVLKVVEALAPLQPVAGAVGVFDRAASLKRRIAMIAAYRRPGRMWTAVAAVVLVVLALIGLTDASNTRATIGVAPRTTDATTNESAPAVVGSGETDGQTITVAGTCIDEKGRHLSGVRVLLFEWRYSTLSRKKLSQTQTDRSGRFRVTGLPAPYEDRSKGEGLAYYVFATKDGRASRYQRVEAESSDIEALSFQMPPAASLTGRVVDSSGKPVAGAAVWLSGIDGEPVNGILSARTDTDGRYEIDDLAAWDAKDSFTFDAETGIGTGISHCYFQVRHPEFGKNRGTYTRIPATVDVVLKPAAIIEGKVIDAVTEKPAAGAIVSAQGVDEGDWAQARTDEQGRYRLTSLLPDKYNIWAAAPQRTCAALDSFDAGAAQSREAPDLELVEGGFIEGRIVDVETGKPITEAKDGRPLDVAIYGPSRPKSGAAVDSKQVNERGWFRLRVAPGVNYPYIMHPDVWERVQRRDEYGEGINVAADEVVSVVFRVLPRKPAKNPAISPVRLPVPVPAEREAAAEIRRLGGWYELDDEGHVVVVNMVYHYTADRVRYDNDNLSDEALQYVPQFPLLEDLLLKGTQANDATLRHVAGMTTLRRLLIWDAAQVTDAGVAHLANLKKLEHVHVSNSQIGDGALETFGTLPNLRVLSLQGNHFTDAGLKHLAGLEHLTSLWIGMNETPYGDAAAANLAPLTTLEQLDLQNCRLSDRGLEHLRGMKELRKLYVSARERPNEITNDGLRALAENLRKLEALDLQHTRVDDEGLKVLYEWKSLTRVTLSRPPVSEQAIERLRAARPDLKVHSGSGP